jgi:hypothetical protein
MEGQRGKRYITWIDKREEMNEGVSFQPNDRHVIEEA